MKIAYLGPEGSYCHMALLQYFGKSADSIPTKIIADTITLFETNQVDYAVIPIENSTYGVVNEALDGLIHSEVNVIGEVILPIQHYLWGISKNSTPEKIYGHPQALAQCQKYLHLHYPDTEEIAVHSNSFGAQKVHEERAGLAIGGSLMGELYQLECIAQNIQDFTQNQTRFMILGRTNSAPSGCDKTSILAMNIPNVPGALLKLLEPISLGR